MVCAQSHRATPTSLDALLSHTHEYKCTHTHTRKAKYDAPTKCIMVVCGSGTVRMERRDGNAARSVRTALSFTSNLCYRSSSDAGVRRMELLSHQSSPLALLVSRLA